MRIYAKICFVLLALFTTLFDVTYLTNFEVYGATVISTFLIALLLAFLHKGRNYLVFACAAVIFFAVFSSLPIILIMINFLALPALVRYIRQRFFPEPNLFFSLFYFLLGTLFFDLFFMLFAKEFSADGLVSVLSFVIINSISGVIIYTLILRARKITGPLEIRI